MLLVYGITSILKLNADAFSYESMIGAGTGITPTIELSDK